MNSDSFLAIKLLNFQIFSLYYVYSIILLLLPVHWESHDFLNQLKFILKLMWFVLVVDLLSSKLHLLIQNLFYASSTRIYLDFYFIFIVELHAVYFPLKHKTVVNTYITLRVYKHISYIRSIILSDKTCEKLIYFWQFITVI